MSEPWCIEGRHTERDGVPDERASNGMHEDLSLRISCMRRRKQDAQYFLEQVAGRISRCREFAIPVLESGQRYIETVSQLHQNGYMILKNYFPKDLIDYLGTQVENVVHEQSWSVSHPSPFPGNARRFDRRYLPLFSESIPPRRIQSS